MQFLWLLYIFRILMAVNIMMTRLITITTYIKIEWPDNNGMKRTDFSITYFTFSYDCIRLTQDHSPGIYAF